MSVNTISLWLFNNTTHNAEFHLPITYLKRAFRIGFQNNWLHHPIIRYSWSVKKGSIEKQIKFSLYGIYIQYTKDGIKHVMFSIFT